jgi:flagellar biosynthetic protein FliR
VRIGLAAFIALAAQASLPEMPVVPLDSPLALLLVAQQVVIGVAMGFAVRLVFAAVEFAGEIIGLQMGLNFAGFFDPGTPATGTATSRFFGTMVAWLFIGGGHLLVIAALVQSFRPSRSGPSPLPSCAGPAAALGRRDLLAGPVDRAAADRACCCSSTWCWA